MGIHADMQILNDIEREAVQNKELRIWKTRNGTIVLIEHMTNDHLISAYKMMERTGFVSLSTFNFYLRSSGPSGDMAQMAFEDELAAILEKKPSKEMDWLRDEMKKRGIKYNA